MPTINKKAALSVAASLALLATSAGAKEAAKETAAQLAARKALAAQYESVAKATVRRALPDVMKVVAPDFQYFDTSGKVTDRIGYERLQRETLNRQTRVRYRYTIESIEWRGADAIVIAQSAASGVYEFKRFELKTTSRDYWSPTPRGWLIRQRLDRNVRGFINGQRVSTAFGAR